jgi:hypothetical protein
MKWALWAHHGKSFNTVNTAGGLENYREHFHHRYPKNQKRQCGHIVVEPMFVCSTRMKIILHLKN